MGLFDFLGRKRKELTLDQVRREEARMGIRENQTLAKLEKAEKQREEIFAKGAKVKGPSRRRQLARLYDGKAAGIKMLERELQMISKELQTLSALRMALERRKMSREGLSKLLNRVDEAQLVTYLEDDKITQEMYMEKLGSVLSSVTEDAPAIAENLGQEGREVMDVWEKMDEGEISTYEDGLKMADQAVRSKERQAELESE